jgi:hypothetical protein
MENSYSKQGVQLVSTGNISDLNYVVEEIHSELHQLEVICESAIIYPNNNLRKATLRRSQILDIMLFTNGKPPIFFKLTEEEQLLVGNHLMQIIKERVGDCLKTAVSVAEGKILLSDIGMLDKAVSLINNKTKNKYIGNGEN